MKVTLNARAFRSAMMATEKKGHRPQLEGVSVEASGRIAATNGHVLYACTQSNAGNFGEDKIVILAGKIAASEETLEFDTHTGICTSNRGKVFTFQFLDGVFPQIDRVIPTLPRAETAVSVRVDSALLAIIGSIMNGNIDIYLGGATGAILFKSVIGDGEEIAALMPIRK